MVPCPADGTDPDLEFSTEDSRFVDDVRS